MVAKCLHVLINITNNCLVMPKLSYLTHNYEEKEITHDKAIACSCNEERTWRYIYMKIKYQNESFTEIKVKLSYRCRILLAWW